MKRCLLRNKKESRIMKFINIMIRGKMSLILLSYNKKERVYLTEFYYFALSFLYMDFWDGVRKLHMQL